jgi:hypothetical protein
VDERLNLGITKSKAVALVLDHVDGVDGHDFDCMRRCTFLLLTVYIS